MPHGLGGRRNQVAVRDLARAVSDRNKTETLASLERITRDLSPRVSWASEAQQLFENWFTYIDTRKQYSREAKPAGRPLRQQTSFTFLRGLVQEA